MARVTTRCGVDVALYTLVMWIGIRLTVLVTGNAREYRVVRWIGVAIRTRRPPSRVRS